MDSDRILSSTCSSVNTSGLRSVRVRYGASSVSSSVETRPIIDEPVALACRTLFFGLRGSHFLVRHYGSDRSCCLPRLKLVSEAVLCSM